MGVYSVMLSDEDIWRAASGFRSIMILGCANCANISIAYDKGLPLSRQTTDSAGRPKLSPIAIVEEGNRLKAFLQSKGVAVTFEARTGLCNRSDESGADDLGLAKCCTGVEAVLMLSCPAGAVGIRERLGKGIRLVPGMKTVGIFYRHTISDHEKGLVYLDRNRSAMIRISGDRG